MFIDHLTERNINGSLQRVRVCAARTGLPPLLVLQAGPGLPLLHEVPKLQRGLRLEERFTVYYWEQRGCGPASRRDAESVDLDRQIDDLGAWLRHITRESSQEVTLLGISLGATMALMAAGGGMQGIRAIVAVSPDLKFPDIDLAVADYLYGNATPGQLPKLKKLGAPPYLEPARFQQRAQLLADAGAIRRGKRFLSLAGEMILDLLKTYGLVGTLRSLRNMSRVRRRMLPELVGLDVLPDLPRIACPVHYVVSPRDPFLPPDILERLESMVEAKRHALTLVPEARHMVHLDCPEAVRSILLGIG